MNKLLTIVIPTYNMQDYLHNTLNSLLVSEELLPLLEVLVINDGSKDESSVIAHEYETKYPAIFRVIDKENGNYGSCVNRGLKDAQGKYIKLLDADDWYETEALGQLMQALAEMDVDMVLTPFANNYENGDQPECVAQSNLQTGKVYHFNQCDSKMLFRYVMPMITYRTGLLRDIRYIQTEGIPYTDTEWVFFPQYTIDTFTWFPFPVYHYRIGREGQTMDPAILSRNIWKYEIIAHSLIDNRKKYNERKCALAEEFNLQQIEFLATNIYRMFLVLVSPSVEDMEHLCRFDDYLKEACPSVYQTTTGLRLKKNLPIHYVRFWRKTGKRLSVDWLRDAYRRILYGKQ